MSVSFPGFFSRLSAAVPAEAARLTTVLCAAFFPAVCAVAVFLCLRHAGARRKFLCFLIGLPAYIIPTLFLLTDLSWLASLLSEELAGDLPTETGLLAAIALGMLYLSVTAAVCGRRVMKTGGLVAIFLVFLVFYGGITALLYGSLLRFPGTGTAHTLHGALPFLPWNTGIVPAALCLCGGFLVCFFLCFLAVRSQKDLVREDILRLHVLQERENRIEKEGVCTVCRYAVKDPEDEYCMICDKKGQVPSDRTCPRFEYDPLKRIPEKPSDTVKKRQ